MTDRRDGTGWFRLPVKFHEVEPGEPFEDADGHVYLKVDTNFAIPMTAARFFHPTRAVKLRGVEGAEG